MRTVIAFLRNCSGATSIEYALLASGVAVAIAAAVNSLGSAVQNNYTSVSNAFK